MEDEENSGLQISLGDLVSFFLLCCAFGVPVLFFSGVRRFVGPQFPHRQLSWNRTGEMKIFASPFLNAVKLSGQEMKKDGETPQSARVFGTRARS